MKQLQKLSVLCLCALMLWVLLGCVTNEGTQDPPDIVAIETPGSDDDPTGLRINPDDDEITRLLKTHLQARWDNDYDTWRSTVLVDSRETDIEFGIKNITLHSMGINEIETTAMQQGYCGSVLAEHKGWSDDFIKENMLIATTSYTVNTDARVPYSIGSVVEPFILIRSDTNSPWLIWNIQDDDDKALVLVSHPAEHSAIRALKNNWIAGRDPDYNRLSFSLHKWENPGSGVVTIYDEPAAVVCWATYYFGISEEETVHMQGMHRGNSSLAEKVGWAKDDDIYENMVVVAERHATYYDGAKVFYFSGPGTHFYVLVRKDLDSPWLMFDGYHR